MCPRAGTCEPGCVGGKAPRLPQLLRGLPLQGSLLHQPPLLQNHPPQQGSRGRWQVTQSPPHPDDQVWVLPAPDFLRPRGAWVRSRKVPAHGQQVRLELSQHPAPLGTPWVLLDEQGGASFQLLAMYASQKWKCTGEHRPGVSCLRCAHVTARQGTNSTTAPRGPPHTPFPRSPAPRPASSGSERHGLGPYGVLLGPYGVLRVSVWLLSLELWEVQPGQPRRWLKAMHSVAG